MRATTAAAAVEEVAVPLSHCTSRSGNATRVDILAGDHGNLSASMLTEKKNNNNKNEGKTFTQREHWGSCAGEANGI